MASFIETDVVLESASVVFSDGNLISFFVHGYTVDTSGTKVRNVVADIAADLPGSAVSTILTKVVRGLKDAAEVS